MSKVIRITDKFTIEESAIEIDQGIYHVDNSVEAVMRFEELADGGGTKALLAAIEGALGKEAYAQIGVTKMSITNLRVLTTSIMAAMQGLTYEEASARFQR